MPRYKLKSGTYRNRRGKFYPGDVFEAEEFEVRNFLDLLERLDPPPEEQEQDSPKPSIGLRLRHKGAGKYDVIYEATGQPINDVLLSKEEAEALIDERQDILEGAEDMAGGDGVHLGWGTEPEADEPGPDQGP